MPYDEATEKRIAETARRCRKYATSLPYSPKIEKREKVFEMKKLKFEKCESIISNLLANLNGLSDDNVEGFKRVITQLVRELEKQIADLRETPDLWTTCQARHTNAILRREGASEVGQ